MPRWYELSGCRATQQCDRRTGDGHGRVPCCNVCASLFKIGNPQKWMRFSKPIHSEPVLLCSCGGRADRLVVSLPVTLCSGGRPDKLTGGFPANNGHSWMVGTTIYGQTPFTRIMAWSTCHDQSLTAMAQVTCNNLGCYYKKVRTCPRGWRQKEKDFL